MKKTQEQISKNMRAVKSKDSKIELMLRKELWHRCLTYRKNDGSVVGKPDIVYKGIKLAIFCDSEFWHGYQWVDCILNSGHEITSSVLLK